MSPEPVSSCDCVPGLDWIYRLTSYKHTGPDVVQLAGWDKVRIPFYYRGGPKIARNESYHGLYTSYAASIWWCHLSSCRPAESRGKKEAVAVVSAPPKGGAWANGLKRVGPWFEIAKIRRVWPSWPPRYAVSFAASVTWSVARHCATHKHDWSRTTIGCELVWRWRGSPLSKIRSAERKKKNETNATYTARTHSSHVQPTMSCGSTRESASFYDWHWEKADGHTNYAQCMYMRSSKCA